MLVLALVLGCPHPAVVAPAPVVAAPAPAAVPEERLVFWRTVVADGPPEGAELDPLVDELVGYLGARDPEIRDGLGYEVLAGWIDGPLPPDGVRRLIGPLSAGLEADDVLRRSFSALTLAAVVDRELSTPLLTDAELADLVTRAGAYADRETDLRGWEAEVGWIHAAAHTADWLAKLASHPRLTPEQAATVLGAVLSLNVRRHGFILHYGEDGRLAQPVLALIRQSRADGFDAWLQQLAAPLSERHGEQFDPVLFAAQRNARNLIFTLFVALSLEDPPTPATEAALASIEALLVR